MTSGSIYQELLGPAYTQLGPVLQHVHGPAPLVQARGVVTVEHGKGLLVRLANKMAKVPPAKENVSMTLVIHRTADRETWTRDFEGKILVTEQWAEKGLFMESAGGIKMGMRLHWEAGILRFESVYTKVAGIRLPKAMGVQVHAQVEEAGKGWNVVVETRSAMLGLLFRYSGRIEVTS
jgi:hypothetical protein